MVEPDTSPAPAAYRTLEKAGRRSSGANGDHGRMAHAVPVGRWRALCGAAPSGRGDWSAWESSAVTCPKCLVLLAAPARPVTVPATKNR